MDGNRFDALAKSLARSTSRRPVVRLLAGGLVALIPGVRGAAAECRRAGRSCTRDEHCCTGICGEADDSGRRRCACPEDLTNCYGDCVDLQSAVTHCGECDNACAADDGAPVCERGKCRTLPALPCPECGECLYCDPAADACVPCADSPDPADRCRTATLCDAANRDAGFLRLHAALIDRGFVRDGESRATVVVAGGTPSGASGAFGARYVHPERQDEEALLVYVPGPDVAAFSSALVLTNQTPDLWLLVDTNGNIEEQPAPPETSAIGNVRAFANQAADPAGCSKCYELCDTANGALGNAVVCGTAGFLACLRAGGLGALGCGISAGLVCNWGFGNCNDVICHAMLGCPAVCDPACERADLDKGVCINLCTKPNTICTNRRCICAHVECGDACCAAGEVCNKGVCAPKCDPCWFPNNSGQCFEVCNENTECCVGEQTPDGVCCTPSEHCCDGVCKSKRAHPKCGSGGHREECCLEGWDCLTASEGGDICCDPALVCGDICCAGGQVCSSPGCCCDGINFYCVRDGQFTAQCVPR
jgi:hypothetical protein